MNKEMSEERERIFIREYPVDFNAARAAECAGFSKDRARQTGYELLQRPHIQGALKAEIQRAMKKLGKAGITVERLLADIDRVGMSAELDCKYSDALKAYELLGKHLKMFTDKIELSGNVSLADRIKAARERIK